MPKLDDVEREPVWTITITERERLYILRALETADRPFIMQDFPNDSNFFDYFGLLVDFFTDPN